MDASESRKLELVIRRMFLSVDLGGGHPLHNSMIQSLMVKKHVTVSLDNEGQQIVYTDYLNKYDNVLDDLFRDAQTRLYIHDGNSTLPWVHTPKSKPPTSQPKKISVYDVFRDLGLNLPQDMKDYLKEPLTIISLCERYRDNFRVLDLIRIEIDEGIATNVKRILKEYKEKSNTKGSVLYFSFKGLVPFDIIKAYNTMDDFKWKFENDQIVDLDPITEKRLDEEAVSIRHQHTANSMRNSNW